MLLAAFLVPVLTTAGAFRLTGNIILLMYVFLLGAFFLALAGLDAGSSFGGMGSSREMTVAALAEPTVMISIFAIALRAGSTGLSEMISRSLSDPLLLLNPGHILAFFSLSIVALAETGRLPVDNPSTHLELTMIHEAMILEYSGRYLALIEWASSIKLFLFLTLLANIFFPWGVAVTVQPAALVIGAAALAIKLGVLAAGLAILETSLAKLRLFRVPELLSGSFMLALLAVVSFFFLR
jgi:formate hydrogenlyase subunit 4